VGAGCGSTATQGVPGEPCSQLLFSEVPKDGRVFPTGSKKEAFVSWAVTGDGYQALEGVAIGASEVGEGNPFVGGAPQGLVGRVDVPDLDEVELSTSQHEVETHVSCCGEVLIDLIDNGEVRGVEPQLAVVGG
jgi:hypothetical protein